MNGMPLAMIAIASLGIVLLFGCGDSAQQTSSQQSSEAAHTIYEVKGRLKSVASDSRSAVIEHETIPDYMPAMTMAFPVKNPAELAKVKSGDAISFRFVVTEDDSWIERLKKIRDDAVAQSPADQASRTGNFASIPALEIGDAVPNFQLTNQDGERFQLSDLAGKHVALTFIFVRCPVPNFCPLMSENFRKLQQKLKTSGRTDDVRLLSITIDPTYDTPAVLKAYASRYTANFSEWIFATGSEEEIGQVLAQFAVYAEPNAGTILHELMTAYISPDGRLTQVWRGNEWKPEDVYSALRLDETASSDDAKRGN